MDISFFEKSEYEEKDYIQGEISQIIPPEKHSKYFLSGQLKRRAEGKYIVNIAVEKENKSWVHKIPLVAETEMRTIILDEINDLEEGEFFELSVDPVTARMENVYQPKAKGELW